MRYMHLSDNELYWVIIPLVALFVVVFNAWRMGKLTDIFRNGRGKGILLVLLAIIAGICLLRVRVLDAYTVSSDKLSDYPKLEEAFVLQGDVTPGGQIVIVEVGNLLDSHEVYLLPCYGSLARDVPQHGDTNWIAEVLVLAADSRKEEEFSTIQIRDLMLDLEFDDETMFSSRVELDDGLYDMNTVRQVQLEEIDLSADERYRICFGVTTSYIAAEENTLVEGNFVWTYDLYYDNAKVAEICDTHSSGTYLVNAT